MADELALRMLGQHGTLYGSPFTPQMPGLAGMNIPGMGGNPALAMMLQPLIASMAGGQGIAALQFMGQQNIYDTFQATQLMNMRMATMSHAAAADRSNSMQWARGSAALMGTPWGPEQIQAAEKTAGRLEAADPILSLMFPDAVDKMRGLRGSATVMSNRMFEGGRFAMDPVTGQFGQSVDSTAYMNNRIYNRMFGGDDFMQRTSGMSAGQIGGMYEEMQRRGFMGGPSEQAQRRAEELEKTTTGPGVREFALRDMESGRIQQKLEGMSKAVAAVREIFGDAGNPDAPMAEIINGLQALTQGGLAQMDGGQLENMVRRTEGLAKMSGMSMGSFMQATAQTAAYTDQLGLNRKFAVTATQDAAAYAIAASNVGLTAIGGFGLQDKEGIFATAMRNNASAAASPMAGTMAGLMMMRSLAEGRAGFVGSELDVLTSSIASGQISGDTFNTLQNPQLLSRMAASGTISAEEYTRMMQIGRSNSVGSQAVKDRWGIGGLVANNMQARDMEQQLSGSLRATGMDAITSRNVAESLRNVTLTKEQADDPEVMAGAILDQAGIAAGDPRRKAAMSQVMSGVNSAFSSPMAQRAGMRSAGEFLQMHGPRAREEMAKVNAIEGGKRNIRSRLAGLGQGGITRNIVEAILGAKEGTTFEDLIMAGGGGVEFRKVMESLNANGDIENLMKATEGLKGGTVDEASINAVMGQALSLQGRADKMDPKQRKLAEQLLATQASGAPQRVTIADQTLRISGTVDVATGSLTGTGVFQGGQNTVTTPNTATGALGAAAAMGGVGG